MYSLRKAFRSPRPGKPVARLWQRDASGVTKPAIAASAPEVHRSVSNASRGTLHNDGTGLKQEQ